jgi:hypothetical protein
MGVFPSISPLNNVVQFHLEAAVALTEHAMTTTSDQSAFDNLGRECHTMGALVNISK